MIWALGFLALGCVAFIAFIAGLIFLMRQQ